MSRKRRPNRPSRPESEAVPATASTLRRKLLLAIVSLVTSLLCAEACVNILFLDEIDTELMMRRHVRASRENLERMLASTRS